MLISSYLAPQRRPNRTAADNAGSVATIRLIEPDADDPAQGTAQLSCATNVGCRAPMEIDRARTRHHGITRQLYRAGFPLSPPETYGCALTPPLSDHSRLATTWMRTPMEWRRATAS